MEKKNTRVFECIAVCVLGLYSLAMLLYAIRNRPDAKVSGMGSYTFPMGAYAVMAGICVLLLIRNLLGAAKARRLFQSLTEQQRREMDDEKRALFHMERIDNRVWLTIGLIVVYMICWRFAGFTLSTFAFVALESKMLKRQTDWKWCVSVAAGATVLVYLVFVKIFSIALSEPLWQLMTG